MAIALYSDSSLSLADIAQHIYGRNEHMVGGRLTWLRSKGAVCHSRLQIIDAVPAGSGKDTVMAQRARGASKEAAEILKVVRAAGWTVETTASNHIKCKGPKGEMVMMSPGLALGSAREHAKADFRRHGIRFPGDPVKPDAPMSVVCGELAAAIRSDFELPEPAIKLADTVVDDLPSDANESWHALIDAAADAAAEDVAAMEADAQTDGRPQDETTILLFRAIDEVKEMVEVLSAEFIDFRIDHARVIAKLRDDIDTLSTQTPNDMLHEAIVNMQQALGTADDFVVRRVERLEAAVKVANPLEALRARLATNGRPV